jgi:hypothetical protein
VVTVYTHAGGSHVVARENFGFDALAAHRTRLTIWQLGRGTTAWQATQAMDVPVQFGSSG